MLAVRVLREVAGYDGGLDPRRGVLTAAKAGLLEVRAGHLCDKISRAVVDDLRPATRVLAAARSWWTEERLRDLLPEADDLSLRL